MIAGPLVLYQEKTTGQAGGIFIVFYVILDYYLQLLT